MSSMYGAYMYMENYKQDHLKNIKFIYVLLFNFSG